MCPSTVSTTVSRRSIPLDRVKAPKGRIETVCSARRWKSSDEHFIPTRLKYSRAVQIYEDIPKKGGIVPAYPSLTELQTNKRLGRKSDQLNFANEVSAVKMQYTKHESATWAMRWTDFSCRSCWTITFPVLILNSVLSTLNPPSRQMRQQCGYLTWFHLRATFTVHKEPTLIARKIKYILLPLGPARSFVTLFK